MGKCYHKNHGNISDFSIKKSIIWHCNIASMTIWNWTANLRNYSVMHICHSRYSKLKFIKPLNNIIEQKEHVVHTQSTNTPVLLSFHVLFTLFNCSTFQVYSLFNTMYHVSWKAYIQIKSKINNFSDATVELIGSNIIIKIYTGCGRSIAYVRLYFQY